MTAGRSKTHTRVDPQVTLQYDEARLALHELALTPRNCAPKAAAWPAVRPWSGGGACVGCTGGGCVGG
jgi:hypothetical protein